MVAKTDKDLWVEMSIREISTQAHFAGIAYGRLDPKARSNNDAIFSSIYSFLSHCAMVSKMLAAKDDGSPPKSIGSVVHVPGSSLIHKRVFRNHLEHYDERLKAWIGSYGVNSMIGTYNIGPKSALSMPGMVYVSHYDPSTQTFTFVNDDFDLRKLANEAERIKVLADEWVMDMSSGAISPPFL